MNLRISSLLLLIVPAFVFGQQTIQLKKGMLIDRSVIIKTGFYKLEADTTLTEPLITIDGSNITVDFNGSTLQGSESMDNPDKFHGLAILVKKGSRNVTIKNANIKGYKIAVFADSAEYVTLMNNNLSYNYRQHLHSNLYREDISDWMSYHHNENDEWLRYGCGIYLRDCVHATVRGNTITNGQCGLMMNRCANAAIFDNNFSFNSGIGIGLYRSSTNWIYHNIIDYNVRGFSFGRYYRGQDSAGILLFEQSSGNVIAFNSVTHSGDGFFLWAGQSTMDSGEGGCNNNLIYGNDFSYAPTNGIEVTFSTNDIEDNVISNCDNGIWGGYSFTTKILGNSFTANNTAIAIEQGQYNIIAKNTFVENKTAVKLWSRQSQPADWGYANKKDVRSRGYRFTGNTFSNNTTAFDILGTDSISFNGNTNKDNRVFYKIGERTRYIDSTSTIHVNVIDSTNKKRLSRLPNHSLPAHNLPEGGRREIRVTEWGPYNFQYPFIRMTDVDSNKICHFEILGKSGTWHLNKLNGFRIITIGKGTFPSTLEAIPDTTIADRYIELGYEGPAFSDMFGDPHLAGKPYFFRFEEFDPGNTWTVNFYSWDSSHRPTGDFNSFENLFNGAPVNTSVIKKIDYTWWGKIGDGLPADSFATVALSEINLPENDYLVGVTADDLAKVLIDGKTVIDAWNAHFVDLDENTHHECVVHLKGKHAFKIIHAEINGLATLMFYLTPAGNHLM